MNKNISNRLIKKLCYIFIVLVVSYSCTDNFEEINTNKTQLMAIGPKEYSELFAFGVHEGLSWTTTDNMSRMSSTLVLNNCGYISCGIQSYDQYMQGVGWQDAGFHDVYSQSLPAILSIMSDAERKGDMVSYSLAQIWKVFQLQRATDIWGPVPYTEAGSGKEAVAYDSQKDIYYMMFEELASAMDILKGELASNSGLTVFGPGDKIYAGNVSKWLKFANTLRLRMAIRISNVEPEKAKQEAEAAIAAGPMLETNADDALYPVEDLNEEGNGMPRMESFYQDVMSTNMESLLKGYNDPRMEEFWSPVELNPVNRKFPELYKNNIGGYHGFSSGSNPEVYTYFRAFSKYGPRFQDGNQYKTPINVMNAAEAYFLKAEGAWRGWNMGGTAESFYKKGIEISIKQWKGTTYPMSAIDDYINGTSTPVAPENPPYYDPPMTDIPVKFSSDKTKQYEQIMTQKWLALFPVSFEAWAEFRRTRLPKLYPKKYSVNANINPSAGQVQTRCPYVESEKNANTEEVEKAVQMLGGSDLENIPLWWDVNPN
ncbi:SusD/RagB family nutrient-binding outer membrane lipoprotein [Mariniphaga sediminis]|uniref:SusD/RagB family nutrient-binding outer membrane lipoprotein n=1 Tax=Mariniphaga sediminis TaxID=1628158 RepID=UPI00356A815A